MKLKEIRESMQIQQKSLAKMLNLAPSTLCQYENGQREPSLTDLGRIADVLGVTVDALLGRNEEVAPSNMVVDLNDAEQNFILAYRRADDHIKKLVNTALEPYMKTPQAQGIA